MTANLLEGSPKETFRQEIERRATVERLRAATAANADPTDAAHTVIIGQPLGTHTLEADVRESIHAMLRGIMPLKTLERVKRYIRRECRKPADMKIRYFYQLITKMNTAEIPRVPPFNPAQGFQQDEIMEIILYVVPKSWIREMHRQGIDPLDAHQTLA